MERIVDPSEVLLELGLSDSATDEERAVVAYAIASVEGDVRRYLKYDPAKQERTEYYPQQRTGSPSAGGEWETSGDQAYFRSYLTAGNSDLQLRHLPVRSITSLYVDYDARGGSKGGSFAASALKTEGEDYWPNYDMNDSDGNSICSDGILRSQGSWPTSPGTIKATYVAGYTDAELHGEDSLVDARPIVDAIMLDAASRARRMFALKKKTGVGFIVGTITGERMGDYSYTVDPAVAAREMNKDLSNEAKSKLDTFVNMGLLL